MSQLQGIEVRRPSRRAIATGAAWAVPVIAVGAAAPSMAASPNEPPVIVTLDPELSCKYPGQSIEGFEYGYRLVFRMTASVALLLSITDVSAPNNTGDEVQIIDIDNLGPAGLIALAAGVERIVAVTIGAQNSANGTGTFTMFDNLGNAGTFNVVISNFHPCDKDLVP